MKTYATMLSTDDYVDGVAGLPAAEAGGVEPAPTTVVPVASAGAGGDRGDSC